METWTLLRYEGYWYWESSLGKESPIFCVKALAMEWRRNYEKK